MAERIPKNAWLVVPFAALCPCLATAANFDGLFDTSNDFGDVGLLQTPTARMRPDGQFGAGVSSQYPYSQVHAFLQLTPWLESVVRYTSVNNLAYDFGDAAARTFSNQHYKDRSVDFKVRLLDEGKFRPNLAFGIQDLNGTGLFSSEYLVSSYHVYDFDFSLGLGWGRLGAGGGIGNPFGAISSRFDRDRGVSSAGDTSLGKLFTGKQISPFGGVLWRTPVHGVLLKLEYDGNDYLHEAYGNRIDQSLPVNVGVEYRPVRGIEIGVGYERGNQLTANIEIGLNFQQFHGYPKVSDPPESWIEPTPTKAETAATGNAVSEAPITTPAPPADSDDQHGTAPSMAGSPLPTDAAEISPYSIAIKQELNRQNIQLCALDYSAPSHQVTVWVSSGPYRNPTDIVNRVSRTLASLVPVDVAAFVVIQTNEGVELSRVTVRRSDVEAVARYAIEPIDLIRNVSIAAPHADDEMRRATIVDATRFPGFDWSMGPALRQSVGGPNNFYLLQLWWRTEAELALGDGFSVSGAAGLNIYNNFDSLTLRSNSRLPHVRSDVARYLKEGENNIVRLETDYIRSPADGLYTRVSAGIFEEMYGGVAAEMLWRPFGRRWAVGVDLNYLKQRDFDQTFDFRRYKIATGFVDFYYQLPFYDVLARVSAGRYLAGDKGATLDLSRQFANGVRAGVFATKTNVSSQQYGEGSFDKGLYIVIPLDLFFTTSSRSYGSAVFRPTTRDGGQRALDGKSLYGVTSGNSPSAFASGWDDAQH